MKKENIPLVVGLAIPVILVVILGLVIYMPRLFIEPQYDFIYAVGDYPSYVNAATNQQIEYTVFNGELIKRVTPYDREKKVYQTNDTEFYRYDVSAKNNIRLADEDVMRVDLDTAKKSPDGFELNYGNDAENIFEGIFGGGRDYSERVLEKGAVALPVNLTGAGGIDYSYRNDWHFIGWVVEKSQ